MVKSAPKPKPKLTDADRHKRFLDMAHEVGASDDPKAFKAAFKKVTANRAGKRSDANK
jgi:hypothetical protein